MKKGQEKNMCEIRKVLYGLKHAPHHIDKYFQESGFDKSPYKHALYVKKEVDGSHYLRAYMLMGKIHAYLRHLRKI